MLAPTLAFGVNSMFGQVYRSGYVDVVKAMPSAPEGTALLPLSERPLLTLYTGQQLLDTLIALANIMFANVVDGSTPQLSLYAVQFGGQLVPVFAVMMVESLRAGNKSNIFLLLRSHPRGMGLRFVPLTGWHLESQF